MDAEMSVPDLLTASEPAAVADRLLERRETGTSPAHGLALLCDRHGTIRRVLRQDLELDPPAEPGRTFAALVDADSRAKAEDFLAAVDRDGGAFDWELVVHSAGALTLWHCDGVPLDGGMVIAAATSRGDVRRLLDGLVEVTNEQLNHLRDAVRGNAVAQRESAVQQREFGDLMRLNNELAATQRELAKRNAELDSVNQQKNHFLGMAAHDLRNPLGVVLAYSQILLEQDEPLSEEQRELLGAIRESSEFMLRMIGDLLDISKIESGTLALEVRPTDLAGLVRRNAVKNQVLANRKKIHLDLDCDDSLDAVPIDPAQIEQVLNNLITNAVKFSHPDTVVRIRLERGEGQEAVLSVADQGQGIPESERHRLFQPFSSSSVKPTDGENSTGLGLMIVKKVVEAHGGRIWVESEVGRGSTFLVALPLDAADARRTTAAVAAAGLKSPVGVK
jgi:signal transduction histidine kinase